MIDFSFKVLGANSATPEPGRFSSSFILQYRQCPMLLDCGEGAQIKMAQYRLRRSKIDHIFISHLHGDHIFGLPGFLNSLGLNGRACPIHLYGPVGIKSFVEDIFRITGGHRSFELIFHELDGLLEHDLGIINGLHIRAFPLQHRIPTLGYRFDEISLEINILPDAIKKYSITIEEIKALKKGVSIQRDGLDVSMSLVIKSPRPKRSFAYCTDTVFDLNMIPHVQDVTMLYHEATYLHQLKDKAKERMHSTAYEAATIAKAAQANQLVIGHYSSRYKDLLPLLKEAQSVFEKTHIAEEGKVFEIG